MRLGYQLAAMATGMVVGALAASAMASEAGPTIHTRSGSYQPGEPEVYISRHTVGANSRAQVVIRPIVDSAATVTRALSEQPVYPHLIEVRLRGGTTFFIDPEKDYVHAGPNPIGANTTIPRAQMLWRHLTARPQIHYGRGHPARDDQASSESKPPQPVIILPKPAPAPAQEAKPELKKVNEEPAPPASDVKQVESSPSAPAGEAKEPEQADGGETPKEKTEKTWRDMKRIRPRPTNPHRNLA